VNLKIEIQFDKKVASARCCISNSLHFSNRVIFQISNLSINIDTERGIALIYQVFAVFRIKTIKNLSASGQARSQLNLKPDGKTPFQYRKARYWVGTLLGLGCS
jgi:hypothetical protein